jgi:nicotinamidase-related amidase
VTTTRIAAEPFDLELDTTSTALLIIDMQRDFVEPAGFGEMLGNDVSPLQTTIEPTRRVLEAARKANMLVIHTREGHRADLTDCPPAKLNRGGKAFIGTEGPMGRILIRGEAGHDIVPELAPISGEPVIDKPGKGAFYATDLQLILQDKGIKTLLVCGVTTEVCVHTTVREANDRGYECAVLADCTGSYFPEFKEIGLQMIKAQGGIFGWVSDSESALRVLSA